MSKLFKKLLISIFIALTIMVTCAPIALAQGTENQAPGPWYSQSFIQWYSKVYGGDQGEIFGERYTNAQVSWVFYGIVALIVNLATGNNPAVPACIITLGTGATNGCIELIKSRDGINSGFSLTDSGNKSIIGMIFEDRPLSGITYIKDIVRKFSLIPEAKAQTAGFGYTGALGIIPIQSAWRTIRDISYAIFVFVIVIFAFMIMFRVKITPQVVISVQSALPKVAIGLVLVTFSYAIAGFMIDLMYVAIGIFSLIFSQFKVFGVAFNVNGILGSPTSSSPNVTGYFTLLTEGPTFAGLKTGIFGLMIMYFVNYVLAYIGTVLVGFVVGFFGTGGFIGGSIVAVVAAVLGFIGLIVVVIMAIINFFRIIFLLAKTFLMIILLTIIAPIYLTLGIVVPGLGFGSWVKSYATKLATFVGVGVLFIFSLWLLELAKNAIESSNNFFTGGPTNYPQGWPPLMGGSPQLLSLGFLLASIAVFVMIPKVGDMIESFAAGKAFNFGSAIGESMSPISAAGQYFSSIQQSTYRDRVRLGTAGSRDNIQNALLDALGNLGVVKRGHP